MGQQLKITPMYSMYPYLFRFKKSIYLNSLIPMSASNNENSGLRIRSEAEDMFRIRPMFRMIGTKIGPSLKKS